jgi:hypothetical protein
MIKHFTELNNIMFIDIDDLHVPYDVAKEEANAGHIIGVDPDNYPCEPEPDNTEDQIEAILNNKLSESILNSTYTFNSASQNPVDIERNYIDVFLNSDVDIIVIHETNRGFHNKYSFSKRLFSENVDARFKKFLGRFMRYDSARAIYTYADHINPELYYIICTSPSASMRMLDYVLEHYNQETDMLKKAFWLDIMSQLGHMFSEEEVLWALSVNKTETYYDSIDYMGDAWEPLKFMVEGSYEPITEKTRDKVMDWWFKKITNQFSLNHAMNNVTEHMELLDVFKRKVGRFDLHTVYEAAMNGSDWKDSDSPRGNVYLPKIKYLLKNFRRCVPMFGTGSFIRQKLILIFQLCAHLRVDFTPSAVSYDIIVSPNTFLGIQLDINAELGKYIDERLRDEDDDDE